VQVLRAREATAKIETENKRIQQQIVELNAQSKEYLAVLSDKDPEAFRDYVIRIAREQLGLSLPGDQVFVDRSFVQTPQK
jgi:cell division protein FtsB